MHIQTIEKEIKEMQDELDVDGDLLEVLANSKEAYLAAKKMEALRRDLPGSRWVAIPRDQSVYPPA